MASRALGTLTLDLLVKMGGFVQGMNQASRVTAREASEMRKSLQGIQKSFEGLGSAVKTFAATFAVGSLFKKVITETINAQQEQAQLAAALKSTGQAAGWTQQQLNQLATKLSVVGGGSLFSEGEVVSGINRMLAYTRIVGDEVPKALQAAIDMATRNNTSLVQSVEILGRALDLPSQGMASLTRQGFKFSDEQKKMAAELERTGRLAEAQKIIFDEMTTTYDGAGRAARDTLQGALLALQGTINSLLTAPDASTRSLRDSIDALTASLGSPETQESMARFLDGLMKIASGLVKVVNATKETTEAISYMFARWLYGSDDPLERLMDKRQDLLNQIEKLERSGNSSIFGKPWGYDKEMADLQNQLNAINNAIKWRSDERLNNPPPAPEPQKNATSSVMFTQPIGVGTNSRNTIVLRETQRALQEQARMIEQYNNQLNDVRLSWMEINGQAVEVAGIKFDQQYDGLRAFLTLSQDWASLGMLDQLKQMQVAAVQFDQAMKPISQTFQNLQYSEQMLNVSKQLGGVSEIGSLIQLAELRRGAFEEVTAQLEELQEVMNSGSATPEMVEQMKQLQLQAAQLEAGLNPLGAKFADVFSKSMESPLFDFISGTKSAGEAFRDMANSIIADLARMALQQSLTNLFSNSGLGGFFGGMFGGGGKLIKHAKGNVIAGGGISALRNSIVTSTTLFPIPPGGVLPFANGGVVGATGEAGPEAIMPLTRSSNGALGVRAVGGGGGDISVTITNIFQDGGTTSQTTSDKSDQNAQALAKAIDQAVKNSLARELMQGGIIWNIKNGR